MSESIVQLDNWCAFCGDVTQTDLPAGRPSGLRHVLDVLRGVEGVGFQFFEARDVVRHPLVQRIVQAYEARSGDTQETGSGYDGHAFWDTEVYVAPMLAYTNPVMARNALRFRVNLLDSARRPRAQA